MAGLLLVFSPAAKAEDAPEWVNARIAEEAPVIAGFLGLARLPAISAVYEPDAAPPGVRVIEAAAEPGRIGIRLEGSWERAEPAAQRQLVRLLAHELSHSWQHASGYPGEPTFLHEGFAEALAIDVLRRCGASCRADPEGLYRLQRGQCAEALKLGRLSDSTERSAVYGCGSLFVLTTAEACGVSVAELYRQMAAEERSFQGFLTVAERLAGKDYALSARLFLTGEFRSAKPQKVFERLRAGRL
jgi:hypothetical protein